MNKRPEYIRCIKHPNEEGTWCDASARKPPGAWWFFTGLDHAAANALRDGRVLPCPQCIKAAVAVLDGARSLAEQCIKGPL